MSDSRIRWREQFETVAVTPLPLGWRNVYRMEDGTTSIEQCPAILLEELRSQVKSWDEQQSDGTYSRRTREYPADPPYETRAVFATNEDGWLHAAESVGNYETTIGPGDSIPAARLKAV